MVHWCAPSLDAAALPRACFCCFSAPGVPLPYRSEWRCVLCSSGGRALQLKAKTKAERDEWLGMSEATTTCHQLSVHTRMSLLSSEQLILCFIWVLSFEQLLCKRLHYTHNRRRQTWARLD